MGFLSPLSKTGLIVLIVFLVLQMMFLAMTLSPDADGLDWARREETCGSVDFEYTFYVLRVCAEGNGRSCEDYDDIDNPPDFIDAAQDDFGAGGGLSATNLTFTLILLIVVGVSLGCGDKVLFCQSSHFVFKAFLIIMDLLMILFSIGAAGVAGDSEALDDRDGCKDLTITTGYGIGMNAFMVFWILAQLGITVFPCGPLAEAASSSQSYGSGAAGSNDDKFTTEPAT